MTQRVALYARYSSDLQSDSSIEDQIRVCSEKAKSNDWHIAGAYTDAGISGASLQRSGIQALLQDAMQGKFDIVLAEAMDRLSRDQEDIAGFYKRMEFAGVKIFTLSEGEITTMHIGLKGTMNALFLQDLADKTRRGLKGRVEKGKSGGGISYGYNIKKTFDAHGHILRGEREINDHQASIVLLIFEHYASGKSAKAIANIFNQEAIPSPSGRKWGQSTINGNRKRGTGILNNELYIGQLIWNRQKFIKNPSTGKRVTRMNPECEWIRKNVPHLRIVPQNLWDAAKARQKSLDSKGKIAPWAKRRPRYLFSGLLKCGQCGGGYSKISQEHYGCSQSRNKGAAVCDNRKTIRRDFLENTVLHAVQDHLVNAELLDVFCKEYTKHSNLLRRDQNTQLTKAKSELKTLAVNKQHIIEAIKAGMPASEFKDELDNIIERRKQLEKLVENASLTQTPLLHPSMASHYKKQVQHLRHTLNAGESIAQAREIMRSLIEKIVLTPTSSQEKLTIDLYGDLAGILSVATGKTQTHNKIFDLLNDDAGNDNEAGEQIKLVAGAGFEPTTFGL